MTVTRLRERTPGRGAPVFAEAMSALASGVALVTCRFDGRPWGMTVTAFASVSSEPPTVVVSLASGTVGALAIAATGSYGVSILAADQLAVARFGSQAGAAKFLDAFADLDALAQFDCEVTDAIEIADHTLFVGRVRDARVGRDGEPLVYHRRGYRTVAELGGEARWLAN